MNVLWFNTGFFFTDETRIFSTLWLITVFSPENAQFSVILEPTSVVTFKWVTSYLHVEKTNKLNPKSEWKCSSLWTNFHCSQPEFGGKKSKNFTSQTKIAHVPVSIYNWIVSLKPSNKNVKLMNYWILWGKFETKIKIWLTMVLPYECVRLDVRIDDEDGFSLSGKWVYK